MSGIELNTALMNTASAPSASVEGALEVRKAFTSFVGETFFGQMIKAMRATTDKPAYFHGGRGEEVFSAQLDQTLAAEMTAASAEQFANPMFERQFPEQGRILAAEREAQRARQPLIDLAG